MRGAGKEWGIDGRKLNEAREKKSTVDQTRNINQKEKDYLGLGRDGPWDGRRGGVI